MKALLERGTTSIELPLYQEGGTPLVSTDLGKPQQDFQEGGILNPRNSDQRSQTKTYTLAVRFTGEDAYQTVLDLADLLKSSTGGADTRLSIPMPEFEDNVLVAPSVENALNIVYEPGNKTNVDVSLSLTRIQNSLGSTLQEAQTPRATGSGPVTISDGSKTVELREEINVERTITRDNSVMRGTTQLYPNYVDHAKAATDALELACELTDNAVQRRNALDDMFGNPLGRSSLTLDFNGLYGMGEFSVSPTGSNAIRFVRPAGSQGVINVPNMNLRVVR